MDIAEWRLHIGSVEIIDAICMNNVRPGEIGEFLESRNTAELIDFLESRNIPAPEVRAELLMFMGTIEDFNNFIPEILNKLSVDNKDLSSVKDALGKLRNLLEELSINADTDKIIVDLSEHGGQPYYTGFTVKAYAECANSAIASGGRYNNLLGYFGTETPAAGFSLLMRKIEQISKFAPEYSRSENTVYIKGENFSEKYRKALSEINKGKRIILSGTDKNE
jgi:ATP phosphoribosyltransferase regulatory subunit